MNPEKKQKKENKKKEVYKYILDFATEKGYPPSVREICAKLSIKSTSTVHGFLLELENEGLIKRDPTKPRALMITELSTVKNQNQNNNHEIVDIPIIGKIAAGLPILAEENYESTFQLSLNYINAKEDLFILKIQGNSMIEAGILDGDYVIIEKCDYVQNGTIAAVLVDNEATLKTFYKENNLIRLQPENKNYSPIIVRNCTVLGRLVSLYRKY